MSTLYVNVLIQSAIYSALITGAGAAMGLSLVGLMPCSMFISGIAACDSFNQWQRTHSK